MMKATVHGKLLTKRSLDSENGLQLMKHHMCIAFYVENERCDQRMVGCKTIEI